MMSGSFPVQSNNLNGNFLTEHNNGPASTQNQLPGHVQSDMNYNYLIPEANSNANNVQNFSNIVVML